MKIKFIFTPLCLVLAVLGFPVGGVMMYFGWHNSAATDPAMLSYAVRQFEIGWRVLLGAVVLGVLAEISLALHRGR